MYRRKDLKQRLFLSADMIGSTAFKQDARGETNPLAWRETVLEFLIDFPDVLSEYCQKMGAASTPELYKSIGDELVFVVKLSNDYREASKYIAAFAETLSLFMGDPERPSVKGAAWLAAFPLGNMEIEVEKRVIANVDGIDKEVAVSQMEYIGPQIDIGFRAAKYSSSMKLAVTIDLALFLLTAKLSGVEAANTLRFHYDGRESLKGVLAERPYPVVSLLIPGSDDYVELRLMGSVPHECATEEDLRALASLCRRFILSNEPQLFIPYLIGCDTFFDIPRSHLALLED